MSKQFYVMFNILIQK